MNDEEDDFSRDVGVDDRVDEEEEEEVETEEVEEEDCDGGPFKRLLMD